MIKLETAMPFFNNNNHFIIFIPHFAQHTQHPTHDIATVVGVVSPTLFHPFFPLIYKNKQMQNSKVKINKKVFFFYLFVKCCFIWHETRYRPGFHELYHCVYAGVHVVLI